MTDAELLQHYIQCKRIIDGTQRSPGHHRLLKLGLIEEHPVSIKNLLITVTAAGRITLNSPCACETMRPAGASVIHWPIGDCSIRSTEPENLRPVAHAPNRR